MAKRSGYRNAPAAGNEPGAGRFTMPEHKSGQSGVPYPEPMMDWERIRAAKARCEHFCPSFDAYRGGCPMGRLPDECARNKEMRLR